ncbi:MAG TPA: NAD(P)-binding domain-containing protein [Kofleriaceae bacterium]|nr:NAD(P)-binding domain-containing protein [Kofleriaceae bacterium]
MNIGIIGAGNIGSALAGNLVKLGHQVSIANSRGPETLGDVAAKTGARPVTAKQAAHAGEIVVLTIPFKSVPATRADFADVPPGVIVIDTNNYYPEMRDGEVAPHDVVDSQWVIEKLGRPVVKVFNNIFSDHLAHNGKPKGTPGRIALPVSGDDAKAKQAVIDLVEAMGFDAIDNGSIADSWRHQPGTPAYTADLDRAKLTAALAAADHSKLASYRHNAEAALRQMLGGKTLHK